MILDDPKAVRGGTFLGGFVRETWGAFRQGRAELPLGTWRRWAIRMGVAMVVSMGVTAVVTKTVQGWERAWLGDWDRRVSAAIAGGAVKFTDGILLESPGNLIYMIPLTVVSAVVAARWGRPVLAVTVVLSWVMARFCVVFWGWHLWDRARPKGIAGGVAAPDLHSFPSGHVILALSVYGLLAWAWCRATRSWVERILAVALTGAWVGSLGYARLVLGSHWPSDVIGGAVLGLVWVGGMIWAASVERGRLV